MSSEGVFKCVLCFYILTSVLLQVSGLSVNSDDGFFNLVRGKRATKKCTGFRCVTDGKCLEAEERCDGKEDCADGSDEFSDCKTVVECPGYLYTCDYGACIETDKVCDGKKDCRDNSDEAHCLNSVKDEDKISSNCKSNEFECHSGQCIPRDNKCNGVADCTDNSDEIQETCLNMYCPGFTFKCDYGACVDGYATCNGVSDCLDNSDEHGCDTTPVVPTKPTPKPPPVVVPPASEGCMLPNHPENGRWVIAGGATANPQTKVGENTILTFMCDAGYKLSSENKLLACLDNEWTAEPPTCLKLCTALFTTPTLKVICYDENKVMIKCTEATNGASAKFECATYYEPADRVTALRFCYDGIWNLPLPQCIPVCGEKRVSAEPLIVNGLTVEKGDYPWVVAIYQRDKRTQQFVNVCGGSMLTQRVIVTAAHCVTDAYGNLVDNEIQVAVGKYYNAYQDSRDTQAQYTKVLQILPHKKYKGENQRYASDIAFLVTTDTLLLSKVVQPVCYHNIDNIHLTSRMEGVITGWGYTEAGGKPSEELKEITIPYKDDAVCASELPPDWMDQYFTYDKFCAGHYNKSIAVCKGDSGGGLVFPNSRDGRYYIHGIVSLGHKVTEGCNIQLSSLFTKLSVHSEWLEQITAKYP